MPRAHRSTSGTGLQTRQPPAVITVDDDAQPVRTSEAEVEDNDPESDDEADDDSEIDPDLAKTTDGGSANGK